ncbi:MAG TPA: hypothetical protein VKV04_18285 [Verrucomicrobiae bacterium]|nr:hypothetical protein [Verrucomicrobiae bacterium]
MHYEKFKSLLVGLVLILFVVFPLCLSAEPDQSTSNSFPTPADVFQGRQFANKLERDVFFLRAIHDHYPDKWPALLEANITVDDYVRSPDKLLRFINELAIAMRDRDDPAACANLARVISDADFFANTNAYHPEILQVSAQTLIQIGPNGRRALAAAFTQDHYRADPGSLEDLAKVISSEKPADPELVRALTATAFEFSTDGGGTYPRCTTEMVKNLLSLPDGVAAIKPRLTTNDIIHDPARFQSVIDGIAAAHKTELATNLAALNSSVTAKLATLTNSPGDYRNDLQDLHNRIEKTLAAFESPSPAP